MFSLITESSVASPTTSCQPVPLRRLLRFGSGLVPETALQEQHLFPRQRPRTLGKHAGADESAQSETILFRVSGLEHEIRYMVRRSVRSERTVANTFARFNAGRLAFVLSPNTLGHLSIHDMSDATRVHETACLSSQHRNRNWLPRFTCRAEPSWMQALA